MSEILKRPSLEYEKDYSTSGTLIDNPISAEPSNDDIYNEAITNLSDKLKAIETAITALPKGIYSAIKTPIAGVRYMVDNLGAGEASLIPTSSIKQIVVDYETNKEPNDIKTSYDTNTTIDEKTPYSELDDYGLEDIPDDVFTKDDGTSINVEIINTIQEDVIDKEYKYDMACIFVDFINNLNSYIANFYNNIIAISTEVNIPSFLNLYAAYDGSSKDVTDNMKPMSDYIVRNQVVLDQQLRMYKKIFDIDSMIVNIRACKSAAELKKRYYKADYVKDNDFLSMNQNDLLANTRIDFDKKYTENLYNLYKYLNSSVILIDECMKLELKMSQAKAALIKNEGVSLQW